MQHWHSPVKSAQSQRVLISGAINFMVLCFKLCNNFFVSAQLMQTDFDSRTLSGDWPVLRVGQSATSPLYRL